MTITSFNFDSSGFTVPPGVLPEDVNWFFQPFGDESCNTLTEGPLITGTASSFSSGSSGSGFSSSGSGPGGVSGSGSGGVSGSGPGGVSGSGPGFSGSGGGSGNGPINFVTFSADRLTLTISNVQIASGGGVLYRVIRFNGIVYVQTLIVTIESKFLNFCLCSAVGRNQGVKQPHDLVRVLA